MNHSEAGKLGAKAIKLLYEKIMVQRIETYNLTPSRCQRCQNPLKYKSRKNKFCSHKCAALNNNLKRWGENKKQRVKSTFRQDQYNYITNLIESGQYSDRPRLKRYLIEKFGYICSLCNLQSWRNQEIPLELDHKDGNAGNNLPSNIRLLCPNCHAQQPTSKGKNRGNGRKSRGLPNY